MGSLDGIKREDVSLIHIPHLTAVKGHQVLYQCFKLVIKIGFLF